MFVLPTLGSTTLVRCLAIVLIALFTTPAACKDDKPQGEQFQFQADVNKLMVRSRSPPRPAARNSPSPPTAPSCSATQDIIINSLYSKKEIFLASSSPTAATCAPLHPPPLPRFSCPPPPRVFAGRGVQADLQ